MTAEESIHTLSLCFFIHEDVSGFVGMKQQKIDSDSHGQKHNLDHDRLMPILRSMSKPLLLPAWALGSGQQVSQRVPAEVI